MSRGSRKHEDAAYTELDEEAMDCTARLWFELGSVSDPDETDGGRIAAAESELEVDEEGVPGEGSPPGTDGTVSEDG